jgi:hypothetical protein
MSGIWQEAPQTRYREARYAGNRALNVSRGCDQVTVVRHESDTLSIASDMEDHEGEIIMSLQWAQATHYMLGRLLEDTGNQWHTVKHAELFKAVEQGSHSKSPLPKKQ